MNFSNLEKELLNSGIELKNIAKELNENTSQLIKAELKINLIKAQLVSQAEVVSLLNQVMRDAKIEEAARLRDTYAQRLQVIEQMLTQPAEDLTALKDQDPIGYAVKMAENMEREKQLQAVRAERESLQAKQASEHQERLRQHINSEQERLRSAIPDFGDEVKGEVIRKEIKSGNSKLKTIGLTRLSGALVYNSLFATLSVYAYNLAGNLPHKISFCRLASLQLSHQTSPEQLPIWFSTPLLIFFVLLLSYLLLNMKKQQLHLKILV